METETPILVPGWVTAHFQAFEQELNGAAHTPLHQRRREAFTAFTNLGLPRPQIEAWKYTDITALASQPFNRPGRNSVSIEALTKLFGAKLPAERAVFIDGRYEASLSQVSGEGFAVSSLAAAGSLHASSANALCHLSKVAGIEEPLVALNTTFLNDGALIVLEKGKSSKLISLIFITTDTTVTAVYPRVLVVAEEGAQGSLVEHYLGSGNKSYFTNAVTEIVVSRGALVDHYKFQREGQGAYHYGALWAQLAAQSTFSSTVFSFGGGLVRNEMHALLSGTGIDCSLNGLTVLRGRQHIDNHTVLDHCQPHSQSNELFKGIYADESSGVFSGTIIVRPDAQKTNAYQSNQSLLLSPRATVDTRPQLKIWADDVKCTHGATVGQIDEEALFYIRSRGISAADARHMLVHAFASNVSSKVKDRELHELLEGQLTSVLERVGPI
jgi:Fe-S cluster assembly protein SufD